MIIGLTGGIACGKSTVAKMLMGRGANLVDADQIAREVVLPGSPVLKQVENRFGQAVLQEDGSLNRKQLGEIVFSDPEAKQDLESILHPPIRELLHKRIQHFEAENPQQLTVADVPLLYEAKKPYTFPEVMVVYVPEEIQMRRLMARDHLTQEQAEARIRSQMPIEEKRQRGDIVIDNSGTLAQTQKQIDDFWQRKGLP